MPWPGDRAQHEPELSVERVRALLDYDPATGVLSWRVQKSSRRGAGGVAGGVRSGGYVVVRVDGRLYRAHRLAWFHAHGRWPEHHLDHINGDTADNRLSNLRDVTRSVNLQNRRGPTKANLSGILGVSTHVHGRFTARIKTPGHVHYLGIFDTPEEAGAAYLAAKARLHVPAGG